MSNIDINEEENNNNSSSSSSSSSGFRVEIHKSLATIPEEQEEEEEEPLSNKSKRISMKYPDTDTDDEGDIENNNNNNTLSLDETVAAILQEESEDNDDEDELKETSFLGALCFSFICLDVLNIVFAAVNIAYGHYVGFYPYSDLLNPTDFAIMYLVFNVAIGLVYPPVWYIFGYLEMPVPVKPMAFGFLVFTALSFFCFLMDISLANSGVEAQQELGILVSVSWMLKLFATGVHLFLVFLVAVGMFFRWLNNTY